VGLPQPIYQGTATLAIAAREIVNREVGGVPERLTEISCRFAGMVAPGTTIRVEAVKSEPVPEGRLLSFRVLNSEGRPAIQKGFAWLAG
jgi:acyl dehydratase